MNDFVPTNHLLEKMRLRNITWAEIIEVLEKPEVTFGPDLRGRKTVQKGDLAVVVSGSGAVITVLLRDADQWTDEDVRDRTVQERFNVAAENLKTMGNI